MTLKKQIWGPYPKKTGKGLKGLVLTLIPLKKVHNTKKISQHNVTAAGPPKNIEKLYVVKLANKFHLYLTSKSQNRRDYLCFW